VIIAMLVVGGAFLLRGGFGAPQPSGPRAVMPIIRDSLGRTLGVEVVPTDRRDELMVPLFRDAQGLQEYGFALVPIDSSSTSFVDALRHAADERQREAQATAASESAVAPRGPSTGPNLVVVVGALLGIVGLFGVAAFAALRRKR